MWFFFGISFVARYVLPKLESMFLTISYISNVSNNLTNEDIESILIGAKKFNDQNDIKGILIYSDQTFFQIIEGEYNKTLALFRRIEKDYRHYGILRILQTKCSQRRYHRFNSHYITYNRNRANTELMKFIEINNNNMPEKKLHNLILHQSRVLSNMT